MCFFFSSSPGLFPRVWLARVFPPFHHIILLLLLLPVTRRQIFHECCFKVVDPQSEREDGDVLCYGEEISLVDDRGMVWNNKDGRLHGRLGPSLFGERRFSSVLWSTFGASFVSVQNARESAQLRAPYSLTEPPVAWILRRNSSRPR